MYFFELLQENEASKIKKEIELINKLTVIDVTSKKDKHARPEGLNTVNLLKVIFFINKYYVLKWYRLPPIILESDLNRLCIQPNDYT